MDEVSRARAAVGARADGGGLIALHPEYHPILEAPQRHLDRDWHPEGGEANPFLHLSLHLAVAEQLAIDQPPGIRAQFDRIRAARGDEHAALHALLECLGEVVWTRSGTERRPTRNLPGVPREADVRRERRGRRAIAASAGAAAGHERQRLPRTGYTTTEL